MSEGGGTRPLYLVNKSLMMDVDVFGESTTMLRLAKAFGNAMIAMIAH